MKRALLRLEFTLGQKSINRFRELDSLRDNH